MSQVQVLKPDMRVITRFKRAITDVEPRPLVPIKCTRRAKSKKSANAEFYVKTDIELELREFDQRKGRSPSSELCQNLRSSLEQTNRKQTGCFQRNHKHTLAGIRTNTHGWITHHTPRKDDWKQQKQSFFFDCLQTCYSEVYAILFNLRCYMWKLYKLAQSLDTRSYTVYMYGSSVQYLIQTNNTTEYSRAASTCNNASARFRLISIDRW